jgi:AraC family transcriptional regulator of adaptative response / DNA-3-methyladenine glycosylase II
LVLVTLGYLSAAAFRLICIHVRKPPDNRFNLPYCSGMKLDPAVCYRAVLARDARYDGRFFTCVKTTGIYCRPICPARPPKLENCRFMPTAAAAQEAGFRPCLRCRPESSPDLDAWKGTAATVSRALKLIESGALDDGDVAALADRLNIGERHLRRLFRQHIGAAPVTVAQTRRVLLAKQLIHQTQLSMAQVALASGFGSIRRFNETFQQIYQRPPGELCRSAPARGSPAPEISLLLAYRPPFDWAAMISSLTMRAITGVEVVADDRYSRVIEFDGVLGTITVANEPKQSALRVIVRFPRLEFLPAIITRTRRMFDLSADPAAIAAVLSADPILRPLLKARPGIRVLSGWDPFEIAVRAVLGQQITVRGATHLAGRIVAKIGSAAQDDLQIAGLTHAFPRPEQFKSQSLEGMGFPRSRAAFVSGIAAAAHDNPRLFDPKSDLAEGVAALRTLPGIGEWTAQYIAMRGLGETDAFLADDIGVLRKFEMLGGRRVKPAELLARAEAWRPWRAYAVTHLWNADTKLPSQDRSLKTKETRHALTA